MFGLDPKNERLLIWIGLGAVAAVLYTTYSAAKAAAQVLTTTGEAIGSGLFDYFNPNSAGDLLYFNVGFPDGSRHSVPSQSVSSSGIFTNRNLSPAYPGDGKQYRILRNTQSGMLYAVVT